MGKSVLELAVNSGQWDAGLKKAGSALNNFVQANGGLQQALDKDDKKISTFVQMMGKMESTATTAKGKMNDYKRSIEQLSEQFNRLTTAQKASVGSQYTATIDQLTRKYRAASAEVQKLNASIAGTSAMKGMSGLSAGIGSAFSAFGPTALAATGVAAAIGGMKSVMSDVVNINKQFEQSSANLAAVMGTTRDQISALTQQAQQLGATTQYTAVQILDLQTNLAKLGFTQQEILSSTKPVQALATATGAELGEAATLAGAALRGFGLNASEMERVASVLAVSTTKSALSFEKLATALPVVQVAASKTGFTIEDTVTMLGKLVDSGMNAASAATQLRKVLNDSTTDGTKLANALGGPVKGFDDLVDKLGKAREAGMTHAESVALVNQRNATALDILRDMAAQYTVTVDGVEKQTTALHEMRSAVTDCSVELQKMQDERLNTLEGSVTIMKSAWEGLMLTFSNSNGVIKKTTDALTRLLTAWTTWRKRNAGGDSAINSYELGLTDAARRGADQEYKGKIAGGWEPEEIAADAQKQIRELESQRENINKAWEYYLAAKNAGIAKAKFQRYKDLEAALGFSLQGMNEEQSVYKAIAERNDAIAKQQYIVGLASPVVTQNEEEEDDPAKASEKLRTIEAQYKEQEVAQIAALDRQAMNEEEYEKKVYEIKRTWLQKIADLYEEGTEQRARANASISSLDIQYQGSVTRRANQQARAEERAAAKEKTAPFLYGDAGMANMASEIKKEMSTQIVGSEGYLINAERIVDLTTFQNLLKTATAAGIQLDPALVVGAIDRIGLGIDIPDKEWNALVETINAHLKTLGIDPIELNVSTGAVKTAETEAKTLEFGWVKAAQAVEQVGSAIQSIEDPSAKIAGIIASAIANVAAGLGGILASQEAMANPWNWVALALSGTATMISTVSAIKSATAGSYAQGGRIEGNSYSGDNMRGILPNGELIGLDAGEIVLNHAQQTNVARDLQGGGISNLKLEALISGRDLRLVLANNDRFFGGSRGDYVVATSRS